MHCHCPHDNHGDMCPRFSPGLPYYRLSLISVEHSLITGLPALRVRLGRRLSAKCAGGVIVSSLTWTCPPRGDWHERTTRSRRLLSEVCQVLLTLWGWGGHCMAVGASPRPVLARRRSPLDSPVGRRPDSCLDAAIWYGCDSCGHDYCLAFRCQPELVRTSCALALMDRTKTNSNKCVSPCLSSRLPVG